MDRLMERGGATGTNQLLKQVNKRNGPPFSTFIPSKSCLPPLGNQIFSRIGTIQSKIIFNLLQKTDVYVFLEFFCRGTN